MIEHLSDYKFNIKFLKGKEMHISDFLSRHPDNDTDSPNEIIPIAFLAKDICHVVTRSMSKKAEADIPTMYPLKGEHRKPEKAKQGIIDLTKKKSSKLEKEKEKCKEKGKIEIKEKEEEDEAIEENRIPLPVIRPNKIQIDMLPNKVMNKIPKPPPSEEKLEKYEGLLKPTPIEIELKRTITTI